MINRGENTKQVPLNVCGSSVFGRYPKIDSEHTFNMFISDNFMVPYPGYKVGINASYFGDAARGRAIYSSDKQGLIFAVFDDRFYSINLTYDQTYSYIINNQINFIGNLETTEGRVYISENNKPQILVSDGVHLYLYDTSLQFVQETFTADHTTGIITVASTANLQEGQPVTLSNVGGALPDGLSSTTTYYVDIIDGTTLKFCATPADAAAGTSVTFSDNGSGTNTLTTTGQFNIVPLDFTPGYITFHDTYFIAAASGDTFYQPAANNTWRLSGQNDGLTWPGELDGVSYIGTLETKPDNTQAVVRFPSRGNMIFVMGNDVTESWYDAGAQLFPYQRSISTNIDYGCISAATVTYMDELVVWLAKNEKSGPVIMASTGDMPKKITTDGIDFVFAHLNNPQDSEAFLYRKDGHIIYHINFYTDNQSYFYDFSTNKIYEACDQNSNYYSMGQVVFYKNQYYSISKDTGHLYIFDTTIYTYDSPNADGNLSAVEIPRTRVCKNIRLPNQDYFIANDLGFTIETGEQDNLYQDNGPLFLITEDGNRLITEFVPDFIATESDEVMITEAGDPMITETGEPNSFYFLIAEQADMVPLYPRIDLSVSYDGGATFGSSFAYHLNPPAKRKNKLLWWQLGVGNDMVFQFRFWSFKRMVVTDGVVSIRT